MKSVGESDLGVYNYVVSGCVCHTSVNPGRCKEEAEFRDAAATGSVKTHFANTLAFLFGVQQRRGLSTSR